MAKNIDEINSVEIDNSSRISGVVPSTVVVGLLGIDDVNGVDNSAPGFSTDYSLDLNGSNQLANFGNLAGTDVYGTMGVCEEWSINFKTSVSGFNFKGIP